MRMTETARRLQTGEPMTPGTNDIDNSSDFGNEESHSREQNALSEIEFRGLCVECEESIEDSEPGRVLGHSSGLGHAWAMIQAELANYRRLNEGDNWSSPHFSVESLLQFITKSESMNIAYTRDKMLKSYCSCGRYQVEDLLPIRQDMFEQHCTNMDGSYETWKRTSFIGRPMDNDIMYYA